MKATKEEIIQAIRRGTPSQIPTCHCKGNHRVIFINLTEFIPGAWYYLCTQCEKPLCVAGK